MKRFMATLLAVALVAALATVSFAAPADIYVKDGSSYVSVTTPAPGDTIYIYLGTTKPDKTKLAHTLKAASHESDKSVSLFSSSSLSWVRLKVSGASTHSYYAQLELKTISASSYPESGYYVGGEIRYNDDTVTVNFDVEYPYGNLSELGEKPQIIAYESGESIDLEFPDGESRLTFTARGTSEVLASMSTDYVDSIGDKYPNANLDFYTSNNPTFERIDTREDAALYIYADEDTYLYQNKSGTLTDLTKYYDDFEGAYVIPIKSSSFTLGSYIVSDKKLSGTVATSSSSSQASSAVTGIPVNPSTGAAA